MVLDSSDTKSARCIGMSYRCTHTFRDKQCNNFIGELPAYIERNVYPCLKRLQRSIYVMYTIINKTGRIYIAYSRICNSKY